MNNPNNTAQRILFVDDEMGVLNAMHRIFHDSPYEVLTASDGHAALELLQNSGPVQVIVSDYRMPGMSGVELMKQVMQRWPDTRRVILSAFPDTDVLLAAVNEGRIHRFLVKLWDNEVLKTVVREMFDEYEVIVNFRNGAEELVRNNRLLSRTNEHLSTLLTEVLMALRQKSEQDDASISKTPETSSENKHHEALSRREREIMFAIASGHSPKAIAMNLNLSIKTVSTYKKRLCTKMRFDNDAELICYTLQNNLLPNNLL